MIVSSLISGKTAARYRFLNVRYAKRLGGLTLGLGLLSLSSLANSTQPEVAPATATALRETQAIELRIARIGHRLQIANSVFCSDIFPLNGLTVKVLSADASPARREAHSEAFGMDQLPTVYLVVPGSAAERAGLIVGDQITAVGSVPFDSLPTAESPFRKTWETLERGGTLLLTVQRGSAPPRLVTVGSTPSCNALFQFVSSKIVNAETFGNRVVVYKGLLDLTRNDDELAVVMAHELAHVLLKHSYQGNEAAMLNRKTRAVIERDADRLGLLLMANAGYSLGSSLSFLLVLNFGAIFGAVGGGVLGDKLNLPRVLAVFFAVAAVSITLLGFNSPMPLLYLLIAIAGATTIGSQILLYACAAQFYSMTIRSTGLGWASGIGRNGAIVGPLLGGALLGISLPLQLNFMAFALPGAVAALAMTVFAISSRRTAQGMTANLSASGA